MTTANNDAEKIGNMVMNLIQRSNLLLLEEHVDEATGENRIVRVWTANAAEQIGELVLDIFRLSNLQQ